MTDLIELAERVEAGAAVPWLTADVDDLTRALCGSAWTLNDWGFVNDAIRKDSLDAVVALLERVLPGWVWLRKAPMTMTVYEPPSGEEWAVHIDGVATSPARALLAAILRALVAKEEDR